MDRTGSPRPVVLAFAPPCVLDDAGRLAAVLRDAEAAGRLQHPGVVPVLATETVDDALAVVEQYCPGPSLRDLLDAAGRLPANVAARVLLEACEALAQVHATEIDGGRRLAHGEIDPTRVLVGEGGATLLCGFAISGGGDTAGDLRALAAVLYESLAGEPPAEPARPLDAPGIPSALAGLVDRALGAGEGGPFLTADALGRAVAGAGEVASREAVAAYAEAVLPAGEGGRAALSVAVARGLRGVGEAEEVSAELIVEPTDPAVASRRSPGSAESSPLLRPPSTRPGVDPAGVFRAPVVAHRRSRLPLVVALCGAAGFGIGLVAARAWLAGPAAPPSLEEPAAMPVLSSGPGAVEAPPAGAPASPLDANPGPPARQYARRAGRGVLDVSAPPDAEVFLDGRRIGRGSVRVEIREGSHRIEVRRGLARVEERFTLAPGETWTYAVTPTR